MANPEHVELVKQGAKAIDAWRVENPKTVLDMSNADLRGADLGNADLSNAKNPPCPGGDRPATVLCRSVLGRMALAIGGQASGL